MRSDDVMCSNEKFFLTPLSYYSETVKADSEASECLK